MENEIGVVKLYFFANSFFDFSKLDIYKCPKMKYGIEN